jgi:iron complex outermembrane recepter protein
MRKFTKRLYASVAMVVLLLFSATAMAQNATIKGTVKDAGGNPLIGATVSLEGQNITTTTDATGSYTLKVPSGTYVIVISFVGQTTQRQTVTVGPSATLTRDIILTAANNENVVRVVGTRSRLPRSNISTPVPVDVITTREVKTFAQTDAAQLLSYVAPSFQSSRQTISDGTDHIDPAGLRGLGPDQTLVLINGKRRHTTALVNINGSVGRGSVGTDLNAIPVAAIDRIEVLRDGAAAQYGSDAIAGVINIVTRTKYKGFNMSALAGKNFTTTPVGTTNQRIGDGGNVQVDFTAGTYTKSGAYINASGQYLFRDRSNRSGFDNIPLVYIGNGGAFPATQTGVDPILYRRFLIDQDNAIARQRGYNRQNIVAGNSKNDNFGAFVNAGLPIGKKINFYSTFGASHRNGAASGFSRNPNAITQQPVTAEGYYQYPDGFLPEIHTKIDDASAITGFRGTFGGFDVDLSNTYGKNTLKYQVKNSGNASLPPAAKVQTEFEAGQLSFAENTVNLDLSKRIDMDGNNSLNVAFGGEFRHDEFKIVAGEPNSYNSGGRMTPRFEIPPYPGTQFGTFINPAIAASGAQVFPGFQPADALNEKRNVYAGYVDLEYTLGKLLIGAAGRYEVYKEKAVSYDGIGVKATARYEIKRNLAVRGSFNTGFRAPSLHQRYFQNTSTQFVGGLPSNSLTANNDNPIVRNAFGINELKPETSQSFSAGVVSQFGNGFMLTVDGYFIKIDDRIVLSTGYNRATPLVGAILNSNNVDPSTMILQFWTNAINTETKGIDVVISKRYTLGLGSGIISLAGNYNRNTLVGGINTNSVLSSPTNNPSLSNPALDPANDLNTNIFDRQQRARLEVGQPRSKVNLTANYTIGKLDILARAVHFGQITQLNNLNPYAQNPVTGDYFNDRAFGSDQTFDAKLITDLVFTYSIRPGVNFSIGANNLFDVYPDPVYVDPRNNRSTVYANPVASLLTGTKAKIVGGYDASRDLSNRGRLLFNPNQFGFNGRYLFSRLAIDFTLLKRKKAPRIESEAPPPPPPPPSDRDKDGVADAQDLCPDEAGLPGNRGCPDKDKDGFADKDDACPDVAGTVALRGCPDKDGDGVSDATDKCPDVPGSPLPQYQGCPIPDTDGDGVRDDIDKCPTAKGIFANAGCPEENAKPTIEEMQPMMDTAARNILFKTGSTVLTTSSYGALNAIAESLGQNTDLQLTIEGHTDNTGSDAANKALSLKRANTVKTYLVKRGVTASRITTEGYGESQPIADNKTAAGRAENRRVVLKLQ